MIYKFRIISDEVSNFKLEISIDADDTFLSLRNAILEAVGYSKDQMDSFIICDEDWQREKEVTLTDMGSDSDEDIWLMEDTRLSDLIEDEGQRLMFVFDYLTNRAFFMEMKELTPSKTLFARVKKDVPRNRLSTWTNSTIKSTKPQRPQTAPMVIWTKTSMALTISTSTSLTKRDLTTSNWNNRQA